MWASLLVESRPSDDYTEGMKTLSAILQQNLKAIAARGPWRVSDVRCLPAGTPVRVAMADGLVFETTHGGTCECCGQAITDIVYFRQVDTSEQVTLGLDCAQSLAQEMKDVAMTKRIKVAKAGHEKNLRAARKVAAQEKAAVALQGLQEKLSSYIEANALTLAAQPHSNPYRASLGDNRKSELEFLLANAGQVRLYTELKALGAL